MAMSEYSLADIAAAADGGLGGGNNSLIWIILFFAIFGFGNGNGFGGNNDATAAAQQEILYGQQFQAIRDKQNEIGNGLCNSTFALNNSITGEGRAIQTQLAQCCCDTRVGLQALSANVDQQTCAITNAVHAEGEATRALINENTMQRLRDDNTDLRFRLSQCDQNAYLVNTLKTPCPVPAYQVPNPNCCYQPGCCANI